MLSVPISVGELLDKVSILRIKARHITNAEKLGAVNKELLHLERLVPEKAEGWLKELDVVNSQLWDIEDAIRVKEQQLDFGESFVQLARSVYTTNDERAAIKQKINLTYGSELMEVKSYSMDLETKRDAYVAEQETDEPAA